MKTLLITLYLTIAVLLVGVDLSFALAKCEERPIQTAVSSCLLKTQTSPSQREKPEMMIEDGMRMILGAIKLILESIPEYKAPEVLENGDIIILRVQPKEGSSNTEDESKKGI